MRKWKPRDEKQLAGEWRGWASNCVLLTPSMHFSPHTCTHSHTYKHTRSHTHHGHEGEGENNRFIDVFLPIKLVSRVFSAPRPGLSSSFSLHLIYAVTSCSFPSPCSQEKSVIVTLWEQQLSTFLLGVQEMERRREAYSPPLESCHLWRKGFGLQTSAQASDFNTVFLLLGGGSITAGKFVSQSLIPRYMSGHPLHLWKS